MTNIQTILSEHETDAQYAQLTHIIENELIVKTKLNSLSGYRSLVIALWLSLSGYNGLYSQED